METQNYTDEIEVLKTEYIRLGGKPHLAGVKKAEQNARNAAIERYQELLQAKESTQNAFTRWSKRAIEAGLQAVTAIFSLLITVVGMLIVPIALAIAEFEAVQVGFAIWTPNLASTFAFVAVVTYFSLLFLRQVFLVRRSDKYTQVRFSLRHVWRDFCYLIGVGRNWSELPRTETPDVIMINGAIRLVMLAILFVGTLGRLKDVFAQYANEAWYIGLRLILEQSSLTEITGVLGQLIAVFAFLSASHFVVVFIHNHFQRLTGGIELQDFLSDLPDLETLTRQAELDFWKELVAVQKQASQTKQNGYIQTLPKGKSEPTNYLPS